MRLRYLWGVLTLSGSLMASPTTLLQSITKQQLIQSGEKAFIKRCSGCHGVTANGKGPAAPMLNPKPRNLREEAFKFRSTKYGTLPTKEDLLRTIDQGIPGTSMPEFRLVSESEKLAIVAFILSLRPEFREAETDRVIAIPAPPSNIFRNKSPFLVAAKRGREVYAKQQCAMCHGEQGRGDGPSADQLMDTSNRPIRPADLSARTIKSGPTARDLYKAIVTGIDGSPMPAYLDTLNEKERWDLVAYLMFLRGKQAGMYAEETIK